jgi:hypothetical protein
VADHPQNLPLVLITRVPAGPSHSGVPVGST